jgi:hypothetical protein
MNCGDCLNAGFFKEQQTAVTPLRKDPIFSFFHLPSANQFVCLPLNIFVLPPQCVSENNA